MTAVAHIPPRVPRRTGLRAISGFAEQFGARWLSVLAVLVALGAVGALWFIRRDRAALRAALRERSAAAAAEIDSLQRLARAREQIIASITTPGTAAIELVSGDGAAARGRAFWNRSASHWTLVAHHLPALARGRVYRLWLVGPEGSMALATFTSSDGEATVGAQGSLPGAHTLLVTLEPERGTVRPTGTAVLRGTPPR